MKDLPPRTISAGSSGAGNNMAGTMKEIGVLGMPTGRSGNKKASLDKQDGSKSTEMWHQDPNTKLIPPA